jgi:PAS domain S-box-containing protein
MGTEDAGRQDSAGSAVAEPALRRRAEEQARGMGVEDRGALSADAARQLVHELRVHQIELETQNEELRRTQEVLEASRARYFDLYDLAPVGYFTLSEQGLILEANLTATTMLGMPRGALVKQPLTRSIVPEDEDIYYLHRKRLLETGAPQACELRMARQYARTSQFWAQLESIVVQDEETGASVCRVTMSDITERVRAGSRFSNSISSCRPSWIR